MLMCQYHGVVCHVKVCRSEALTPWCEELTQWKALNQQRRNQTDDNRTWHLEGVTNCLIINDQKTKGKWGETKKTVMHSGRRGFTIQGDQESSGGHLHLGRIKEGQALSAAEQEEIYIQAGISRGRRSERHTSGIETGS